MAPPRAVILGLAGPRLSAEEAALKAAKVEYEAFIYPGTNHGFHNDTTPRFDKAAAELSWTRTIEFFKKKLG